MEASCRLLKVVLEVMWNKIAMESEDLEKHAEQKGNWASCGGGLGGILDALWSVLEAPEGVLEAS